MKENNVILIPAHNEGNVKRYVYDRMGKLYDRKHRRFEHLRKTIQEIRRAGFTGRIVVINDGSTDNTSQVAKEEGAEVINLKKRRGKAKAVFYGLARVARSNPTSVLIMDADLLDHPSILSGYDYRNDIGKLVNATNNATKEGRVLQVIARVHEAAKPWALNEKSGIRCFSRRALTKLVKAKKPFVKEFQLENYLNKLFKYHTEKLWTHLTFRAPLQTKVAVTYQCRRVSEKLPKNIIVRPIPRHK